VKKQPDLAILPVFYFPPTSHNIPVYKQYLFLTSDYLITCGTTPSKRSTAWSREGISAFRFHLRSLTAQSTNMDNGVLTKNRAPVRTKKSAVAHSRVWRKKKSSNASET
jgi:hypothetical protein